MVLFYPTGEYIRLSGFRLEGNGCTPDISFPREKTANDKFIFDFLKGYKI